MPASPFYVISTARSGSNQLVSYINQLSHCRCLGEVFKDNFTQEQGWQKVAQRFAEPQAALALHRDDLTTFWSNLTDTYADEAKWFGAKIFYAHCQGDAVWERIFDPATPVLHLWRPRIMDTFLSRIAAEATGQWSAGNNALEAKRILPMLQFPLERYLDFRQTLQTAFRNVSARLEGHTKCLSISYDEIAEPSALSQRLTAFFGTTGSLKQTMRKLLTEAPETFIVNIEDMRLYRDDRLDREFAA